MLTVFTRANVGQRRGLVGYERAVVRSAISQELATDDKPLSPR